VDKNASFPARIWSEETEYMRGTQCLFWIMPPWQQVEFCTLLLLTERLN
jgi:hypothetical protein